MKKSRLAATMAVVISGAMLASVAHAQTKAVEGWQPQQKELDPAKRVQPAPQPQPARATGGEVQELPTQAEEARSDVGVQPQAYAARSQPAPAGYEEGRGGFFLGVKGGKGWVYDSVDQSAREINAGYRWQAGAVTLVGIEVARGALGSTTDDGVRYGKVDYASIGANARFNFGTGSPVFGLVRAGYWAAEDDDFGMDVDGGYFGLGLGVDINRHVNLSLTYTNYVYFDAYSSGYYYEDVNRADTVMFGIEARF